MNPRFRPRDPAATHARFTSVVARVTKKVEAEVEAALQAERDMIARLKAIHSRKRAA
jgi:hypothetical protein